MTHFRAQARAYAASRPRYPKGLFTHLAQRVPTRSHAWDVGTGSGQAARDLAAHFERVTATDTSPEQLAFAPRHPRITYLCAPAERAPFDDASLDLITVASALHWFDLDAFYTEAQRCLQPGGLLAAWAYAQHHTTPAVLDVTQRLSRHLLADFWPQQNHDYTFTRYATLPFPFTPLEPPLPPFTAHARLHLHQYQDYMRSWSATQRYIQHHGHDPVEALTPELTRAWGDPNTPLDVTWPLFFRIGRHP